MAQNVRTNRKQAVQQLLQFEPQDSRNSVLLNKPAIFTRIQSPSQSQSVRQRPKHTSKLQNSRSQVNARQSLSQSFQQQTNTRLNKPFRFERRAQAQLLQDIIQNSSNSNSNSSLRSSNGAQRRQVQSAQSSLRPPQSRYAFGERPLSQVRSPNSYANAQKLRAQSNAHAHAHANTNALHRQNSVKDAWLNSSTGNTGNAGNAGNGRNAGNVGNARNAQRTQSETQELQRYLIILNCKYPGHKQKYCDNPPSFPENLRYWGNRLREDYPSSPYGPQDENTERKRFTDEFMVKKFGQALESLDNRGPRTRRKAYARHVQ